MKKLFSLLICAVLILGMTFFTVPANAIEIDAPAIGTITSMENMMKMAESYVSPTGLYQGDKKYCYLALFRAAANGITKFSGDFMYNSALTMVECTPSKAMIDLKRSNDFSFGSPSGSSQKTFDFSTNDSIPAPAVGTDLFEFHLQGGTYINPQTFNTSYSITYGGQPKMDTGLTLKKVLMGDVNGDRAVSETDAMIIMQAAGGKTTITGDNSLAADVNRDGEVNTSDALAVLQYSTNKLTSFWNHGYNSTEENENITSGKIYRMFCYDTGKNLKIPATGKTVLSDYERTSDDYKFRFTYLGNGLYKIAKKADGTSVLTAGTGCNVSFATYNSSNAGQKWYVNSKNGEDFYLCPLNAKNTFLTSSGTTSAEYGYNAVGGIWRIYGAEVTIYNYYDNSYVKRHASSGVTPQDYISDCQSKLNAVLESVFDLKVVNGNTPTLMQSYVDQCTELDPDDLDSYCNRCPDSECNEGTDGEEKDFTKGHHTSFLKNIYYFQEQYPENTKAKEIRAFSIGHNLCVYDDNGSHISCWAGVSLVNTKSPCVTLVDVHEDDRTYRSLCTMLHEQSHQLGALKGTTGGKADTNHDQCVMSYNRSNESLKKAIVEKKYDEIYCNACKQAIKTYIDNSL